MHDLHRAAPNSKKAARSFSSRAPDGFDAFVAADLARAPWRRPGEGRSCALVHVARDSQRLRAFREALAFAAPDAEILEFPAWDCQPYDRVSPNAAIAAQRMTALARLARTRSSLEKPRMLLTTVAALDPARAAAQDMAAKSFSAAPGAAVDLHELAAWLDANGFVRASTVRESGEYALRGGIVDLYPPSLPGPVRLDFFGDVLETIRAFDPESQRTTAQLRALDLVPVNEAPIPTETIKRFRQSYIAHFGAQTRGDALYEAVSEGRRPAGPRTLAAAALRQARHAVRLHRRRAAAARRPGRGRRARAFRPDQGLLRLAPQRLSRATRPHCNYKPLPPDELYLVAEEFAQALAKAATARFTPFAAPEGAAKSHRLRRRSGAQFRARAQ